MAAKLRLFPVTHESVTVPVGRDRKKRTALSTSQIARFVTAPLRKKNLYLVQVTLTKLLLKDRGCVQRFSIDADINHFILQLFCRGS